MLKAAAAYVMANAHWAIKTLIWGNKGNSPSDHSTVYVAPLPSKMTSHNIMEKTAKEIQRKQVM